MRPTAGGTGEQVEGEEEIAPEGDQAGVDGDHGLRAVLAAVLDHAGGADIHAAQTVPVQDRDHDIPVGRLPELQQQRHEPDPVRVPQRQLQEELPEGVHVRRRQGRERRAAPGEQHVPAAEPRRLGARRPHRPGHHHTVPPGDQRRGRRWRRGQRRGRVHGRRRRVLRRDGTAGLQPRRTGQQGEHVHRAHHDVPVNVQRQRRTTHPVVTDLRRTPSSLRPPRPLLRFFFSVFLRTYMSIYVRILFHYYRTQTISCLYDTATLPAPYPQRRVLAVLPPSHKIFNTPYGTSTAIPLPRHENRDIRVCG